MKSWKLSLLLKEFPFLAYVKIFEDYEGKREVPLREVDHIRFAPATSYLLSNVGDLSSYSWSRGHTFSYHVYYAVVQKEGNYELIELQSSESWAGENYSDVEPAPNIAEQLSQLGLLPEYLVMVSRDDPTDDYQRPYHEVKIFKMNKLDLKDEYRMRIRQAAEQIIKEMEAAWSA